MKFVSYEKGDSGFWVLLTLRYKRGYEIQKEITIDSFVFHDSHILKVEKEPDFAQSLFCLDIIGNIVRNV